MTFYLSAGGSHWESLDQSPGPNPAVVACREILHNNWRLGDWLGEPQKHPPKYLGRRYLIFMGIYGFPPLSLNSTAIITHLKLLHHWT